MNVSARRNVPIVCFAALLGLAVAGLTVVIAPVIGRSAGVGYTIRAEGASSASLTRLAPGTKKLLRQTAEHLSRMQGGVSIGGFPPFKPPEDDERHREKIKNRAYSPEEANHWLGEMNNFLRQIADKNPGMTLEEILLKQGRSPAEIENFLNAIREARVTADGMSGYGVQAETAETLESLMQMLEVSSWTY